MHSDFHIRPRKPQWFDLGILHPPKSTEVWVYFSTKEDGRKRNFIVRAFRTEGRKFFNASNKEEIENPTHWCDCSKSCPVWDPQLYED